jgi:hypothetical protein
MAETVSNFTETIRNLGPSRLNENSNCSDD